MEVLVASAIVAVVFSSVFFILFFSQRNMQYSYANLQVASEGRTAYQKIAQVIYQASSITVSNNNNTVTAVVPINDNGTTVKKSFTLTNSKIVFDPDISTGGNEMTIAKNIIPLPAPDDKVFQSVQGGRVLSVNFLVGDPNKYDDLDRTFAVITLVKLRNYK